MNTSGEAADQIVRMSLEVGEAALKITGAGAKQLAVLLYAVLKEETKTRGKARLETLVRSGKPLTVFSVKESDLEPFVTEAKRYGVMYSAVRDPKGSKDGMVDVIVKEEDAARINRIVERFKFASVVEAAQIKTEIEKSREEKGKNQAKNGKNQKGKKNAQQTRNQNGKNASQNTRNKNTAKNPGGKQPPEQEKPDKSKEDKLLDELLGEPVKKEGPAMQNPSLAKTEKSHLSAPTSAKPNRTAEGTSKQQKNGPKRASVRGELNEIKAARKQEAGRSENTVSRDNRRDNRSGTQSGKQSGNQRSQQHKQPPKKKKNKSKNQKVR